VSGRASGARIEAKSFAPSAEMAHLVEVYWAGRWDLRGQPPHTTKLLGDPCVHIVFEDGQSRVVGVWTRTWKRTLEQAGVVRGVKIRAGAVAAFFAEPARELTDRIIPLARFFNDVPEIEREVLGPDDHRAGVARLELWLRDQVRREAVDELDGVTRLLAQIAGDRSIVTVEDLASRAGIAVRVLQRSFRIHVGAPPKWVIRRHRLQEAALRIERGEDVSLARLATELGYADQAHLSRDFKSAVGLSPKAFSLQVNT
jgi:AraC-like DNA-binding protein